MGGWENGKQGNREIGRTGDGRWEMGDGRRETGDGRRETGDGRRETGDGRQETGDGRWETGDGRWEDMGHNGRWETGKKWGNTFNDTVAYFVFYICQNPAQGT
ncbi:hypothetical protein BDR06DRAFT_1015745 [Suillus hirtellus]|nr:hypothetical protein BDR06DRAFT_1015745 [Suillus hirtellus]